jgi:CHAD domain-containing protein
MPQIHGLRIAGKYFRYTLEFFREVLAKEAAAMIRDVVKLQDGLGELHDADVATTLVRDYVSGLKGRGSGARNGDDGEPELSPGLTSYLDELQSIMDAKRKEYVSTWAALNSPEWRKKLATLLVRDS